MRRFLKPVLAALIACSATSGLAQSRAVLIADSVYTEGHDRLIASGHVEVFFQDRHLRASRLTFDQSLGRLSIEGPIILNDGDETLILADSAELSQDLQTGILQSARLVLGQQLQIAATEINRVEGRYTQLYQTVASSCEVCVDNPIPLWQIRATRIIHDQQERQLYFDNAQFRVMDVPIFWAPRLRLPDPTLERATGFLTPSLRSSSRLGLGIKAPYFIRIGDHRDLTITPYFSSRTRTLELRYRQAFHNGDIEFTGSFTNDDLIPNATRGYLFGSGSFDLARDFELNFNLETVSDKSYLLDYGYSPNDRLESNIQLTRTRNDTFFNAEIIDFKSLRAAEDNANIPGLVANVEWNHRFVPGVLGGTAEVSAELFAFQRASNVNGDLGRDMGRFSAHLNWRRNWVSNNGIVFGLIADGGADYYTLADQAPGEQEGLFYNATLGGEVSWPFAMTNYRGIRHVVTPTVQLLWTDTNQTGVPNEDSTLLEFDEGNLFALSRYAGSNVYEEGTRFNVGLTWSRIGPSGITNTLSAGRIFRDQDYAQFTAGSGLTGAQSDWLLAYQLQTPQNITLTTRALFNDQLDLTRNETRISWRGERLDLGSTYVWLDAAPAENRLAVSEWTFDTSYRFNDVWTGTANWRHDFQSGELANAGLGLTYHGECVKVDLSVSRRFTSTAILQPNTSYGLTVSLVGFGASGQARGASRSCIN
ncbi:LPS-assembly protein LptD [Cochlodiniinecator piscidefendens]|uniref:LPS-assembly protein LptD n=1 Tax=Cochlodiniinecator piscidefendens TaxID=2715756 RepID=UPI00140E69D9|nr:LPS assembly protein LptD [Cochlodiniinecator piscidefendens]